MVAAMESIKSWEGYYRDYLEADNQTAFWFSYFNSNGFSRSPYKGPFYLKWYVRDDLLVGNGLISESSLILWEFRHKDWSAALATTSDEDDFHTVPEVLWVLDCLRDPLCLPLLIGIDWIAPLVSVLLQRSAAEKLPTKGFVL